VFLYDEQQFPFDRVFYLLQPKRREATVAISYFASKAALLAAAQLA
jgi:hypothetical protein